MLLAQQGVSAFGWPDATLQAGLVFIIFAALFSPRGAPDQRSYAAMDRTVLYIPVGVALVVCLWHIGAGHLLVLGEAIPAP